MRVGASLGFLLGDADTVGNTLGIKDGSIDAEGKLLGSNDDVGVRLLDLVGLMLGVAAGLTSLGFGLGVSEIDGDVLG